LIQLLQWGSHHHITQENKMLPITQENKMLPFENVKTVDPTFETAPEFVDPRLTTLPTHRYLEDIFIFGLGSGIGRFTSPGFIAP